MQNTTLVGLAVALGSGLAIGVQATLFTVVGRAIGPVRASLVLNVTGGVLAGLIMAGAIGIQGRAEWNVPRITLVAAAIAVGIGIAIVMGVAFSFQRMGVATGQATVFLGQMLIGVIVDALGRAGGEPVPLDLRRVLGLVVMAIAVGLLVRQG